MIKIAGEDTMEMTTEESIGAPCKAQTSSITNALTVSLKR